MPKFNLYLFDGAHTEEDHYNAIARFAQVLDDVSIVLVDDWNYPTVRTATLKAIDETNMVVMYKQELISVESYWNDNVFGERRSGTTG
jgi:hypothetical protein